MGRFQYLFRFCCDPGHNRERELDSLVEFVKAMGADDVMVFCNVQELNTGHTTPQEQEVYLRLLEDVRERLPDGVTLSVNQWHSLMHMDQGKTLKPGQDFRLMRDADGKEATLCVCPAGEAWLEYISGLYARYAGVMPLRLWIEDDFRFHNHAPLSWGGCFCQAHLDRFSRAAGKELDRADFVRGMLQPGAPHPYRRVWLDSCRDDLLLAAGRIGQAVEEVCPTAQLGLMSSLPQVHAAEGRDWAALLVKLARGNPMALRIHLPAYSEMSPGRYMLAFNQVSMLNRAFVPPETEVYPELENFPYSLYTKSRAFTRFQMLSALPLNVRGMTIDLFDLNGNGIVWPENWQEMFRALRPILDSLQDTGVFQARALGVRVLVHPDSSYTLHTRQGREMEELYPHETLFAGLFGAYGISFSYVTSLRSLEPGDIVAVCGQVLRNFDPQSVAQLFGNHFVLLNGDAAETLYGMGLGHLAGIASCRWIAQDSGAVSYEQAEDGRVYGGIHEARASAMVSCCDVLSIRYSETADVRAMSGFYGFDRGRVCHGQAIIGGSVYIFPFGRLRHPTEIPPMLLNALRAQMLADYLPATRTVPRAIGLPHLNVYAYWLENRLALYAVNAAMDDCPQLEFRLDSTRVVSVQAQGSARGARAYQPEFRMEGERLTLMDRLPAFESVLLLISFEDG